MKKMKYWILNSMVKNDSVRLICIEKVTCRITLHFIKNMQEIETPKGFLQKTFFTRWCMERRFSSLWLGQACVGCTVVSQKRPALFVRETILLPTD